MSNEKQGDHQVAPVSGARLERLYRDIKLDLPPAELAHLFEPRKIHKFKRAFVDRMQLAGPHDPIPPRWPSWVSAVANVKAIEPPDEIIVRRNGKVVRPLVVSQPDGRETFTPHGFPWGCVCRIITGAGSGSGVIVGPRHVLTANHVVNWAGSIQATVHVAFDGFYQAKQSTDVTHTISIKGVQIGNRVEYFDSDEDYAVLVTRDRIGDTFGHLGVRTYDSGWDGQATWHTMGYPGDTWGGAFATKQSAVALDEAGEDFGDARSISTNADVYKGQSGSPMFGFWNDGPYVVAVVSSEDPEDNKNWCAGGNALTGLVRHALRQYP